MWVVKAVMQAHFEPKHNNSSTQPTVNAGNINHYNCLGVRLCLFTVCRTTDAAETRSH